MFYTLTNTINSVYYVQLQFHQLCGEVNNNLINNPPEKHMFRKFLMIAAGLATLGLQGCIVVPTNGYGQAVNYRPAVQQQACPAGSVQVGNNQYGQPLCQWQNGAPSGLPRGCVRTVYGMHCSQADGYQLQQPVIPPPVRRMQ